MYISSKKLITILNDSADLLRAYALEHNLSDFQHVFKCIFRIGEFSQKDVIQL